MKRTPGGKTSSKKTRRTDANRAIDQKPQARSTRISSRNGRVKSSRQGVRQVAEHASTDGAILLRDGASTAAYNPVYARKPFLAFHTVTKDTRLEELNLNWRESDLPERERTKHVHRLHPYLGKFIPQLVEIFLRKYFQPGMTVADPFAGSGTTLVQANELGINSVGYDVSMFNVLLMRAKTARCDPRVLKAEVMDALSRTRTMADSRNSRSLFEEMPDDLPAEDSAYLKMWYSPRALRELLAFRQAIITQRYENSDILKVILSRAARSARLTTHYDLDFPKKPVTEPYFCYKHGRVCQPTNEAMRFLVRYAHDTVRRVATFQALRTEAKVEIYHADSRTAEIPPIDGVFTSPPYVGLIDYHEQHAYAYHLLGLQDCRAQEIGAASAGTSMAAREKYKADITVVFARFLEKMPKGGYMIVVAGDKYNLYPEIADRLSVEVEGVIDRHVNRRTGRRSTPFFESVFIWRKK